MVVPLVIDLVRPRNVVDVGCGTGAWLSVFISEGISDVIGIDGDYIDRALLRIPEDRFDARDLEQTLRLERRFDLVTSLEVAEHLSPEAAENFVESLVSLGDVVLFSAAVPAQGGHHHLNEQWPSYWADLFAAHNYVAIDCIRSRIWDDPHVDWWYAQNSILYVERGYAGEHERLSLELQEHGGRPRSLVHPRPASISAALARQAAQDIDRIVGPLDVCVLIDEGGLPEGFDPTCTLVPFMEREHGYAGLPTDSDRAIEEFMRLIDRAITHVIVTWACFWWCDFYDGLFVHVNEEFTLTEETDAVLVFGRRRAPR